MTAAYVAQIVAARPEASTWVSANAGSGKTRVLTDRVARLLLAGTEPQKILCLTYTKAAAAEMQTRLYKTLGAWAMMPESELRAALTHLGEPGGAIPRDRLDRARTLFAKALETPGGLRIQTIHAFCDALLRRFPLEAGVPPQFGVLEDRQARALRAETLDAIAARGAPEFAALASRLSGDDPDPLLAEINRRRELFVGFDAGRLRAALGAPADLDAAAIEARVMRPGDRETLAALVRVLETGKSSDAKCAAKLRPALALRAQALIETLEDVLLFGRGAKASFAAKLDDFPTLGLRTAHPALMAEVDALALRVEAGRADRLSQAAYEKALALNAFARVWIGDWAKRKAALGLLDFDDLVDRARRLLRRPDTAAWVLWRLDGGLDHILVDEAQDTSPAQWSVIEAISREFFAGSGARETLRTIFVVGDEKQSIYSFQGADPRAFGDMRRKFDALLDDMGGALAGCDLLHSFRSAAPILRLVDAVFGGPAGAAFGGRVAHIPIEPEAPGRVELWPFVPKPEKPEESPWDRPLDMPPPDDPVDALARRIAGEIRGWLDAGRALPGAGGRAIRPSDVLILVQRRAAPFHAIIRALKRAGVPVAGADVLRVGGELAVKDLLAALRVAATSVDDLSLAAVLRSPLGGFGERELFELAYGRAERTLWEALGRLTPAPDVLETLRDLRAQADFLRPFELLQRVLVRHDGRRLLVARLGPEAEDGIDALLEQAMAYESVEPPTLTGFLDWIDRDEVTVKRRTDEAADQVRVMTVHGAKGLEAPIVILPDTARRQEGRNPPEILAVGGMAAWRTTVDECPPALAAAEAERKADAAAENRRLLYVALTRAKRWLIVAGAGAAGAESWHAMTADALDALGPDVEATREGPILSLSHNWPAAAVASPAAPAPAVALPDWARRRAPPPDVEPPPLSPSNLGGAHALPGEGEDEATARARGASIHRLLETLPGRPRSDWPALAERVLSDAADGAGLLAEAARVLEDPALAPLFAAEALVETDVSAALPALGGARVLGRIDRLIVSPERILAVDFKSNRVVPDRLEDTPEAILRQMGAYAAALAAIWPGRRIETAVLWTRAPRLVVLPPASTAAALARAARLDPAGGRP